MDNINGVYRFTDFRLNHENYSPTEKVQHFKGYTILDDNFDIINDAPDECPGRQLVLIHAGYFVISSAFAFERTTAQARRFSVNRLLLNALRELNVNSLSSIEPLSELFE